jgi:hypothetical protein
MMLENGWSGLENLNGSRGNLLERMKGEEARVEVFWMGRKSRTSFV